MLCTKALGYKILSNVCIQTLFFDVKTFQSPNHRYNGSYVNIYADEQIEIVVYNKSINFKILSKFYFEHLLI